MATNADRAKQLAMDLEVQENALLVLCGNSDGTQDEARTIREYILKSKIAGNQDEISVVIVTSKYHSYRAKKIFEKALNQIKGFNASRY
ncbi:hypothetical protein BHU72_05355 [Desulfuribacillus stibiiarsenatis]|uniref:DUF218 domain-containing protein n=1 Tax=Desulfuribacillus stibiiarsenatis TaxID=1390249 RepID=A0A1E5L682_9FIRM|nr:ElyC/SanA/YdcF family protein [Desulfuribacillus stibiiarsenatis]OEH85513.1 hypothetical protein BHU72_05355 [Desulfuribacillus stibiiarsenatis]